MEEKELVSKIIKKDKLAFEIFYRKKFSLVFNFVKRIVKNKELSEEISQEVFIDFLEQLRDFHFQSSLTNFLLSIARNKAIDYLKKKRIKKILFSSMPHYVVESLKTVFLDDELEKKELAKKIKKVFKKLPNDYQLILRQKYIDGERVTAIAQKFKMGFKATESLLFRARKAFIKVFNEQL